MKSILESVLSLCLGDMFCEVCLIHLSILLKLMFVYFLNKMTCWLLRLKILKLPAIPVWMLISI